ncbi:hypothetical protein ACL58G_05175 [Massilia sp. GER05]|uniref:hypothetical protein n=1 Tax=unclassified Massilia TaxID=2609279 RepID=UPI0039A40474
MKRSNNAAAIIWLNLRLPFMVGSSKTARAAEACGFHGRGPQVVPRILALPVRRSGT